MKKRINFKIIVLASLLFAGSLMAAESVRLDPSDTEQQVVAKAASVRPHPRQVEWQEREFTMFAHFGMNTFTGKEWGNGKEDPKKFDPTELDARQWAKTAKDAGMKRIIVTAKHHDGFCLWPSAYTEYSIKNSPYKNGKGDVVKEVAEACREYGLEFGFYLSPWDRHEPTYGTAAYNDYYKNQLRELLTNYGPVSEVWMDGAGMGEKHKAMVELYDWDGIFALIRELAPDAALSIYGPDVRWVGNEAGNGRESEWSVVPEGFNALDRDIGGRDRLMEAAARGAELRWYPAQVDVSIRPGWFYHKREDLLVKSVGKLQDIYYDSVGANAQLLLNVPPDRRGLIYKRDAARLARFGKWIEETFSNDLAAGAKAHTDAAGGAHPVSSIIGGNQDSYWRTGDGVTSATAEIELVGPQEFNVIMLQEPILHEGQRIEEFAVDVMKDGQWQEVARTTTIGYKRLLRIDTVTADRVRLRVISSREAVALSRLGLFLDRSR